MISEFQTKLFKQYCHKARKDYFCCHIFSKYAPSPLAYDESCVWSFGSFSYVEVSCFASMFSYIPDAYISISCIHYNNN